MSVTLDLYLFGCKRIYGLATKEEQWFPQVISHSLVTCFSNSSICSWNTDCSHTVPFREVTLISSLLLLLSHFSRVRPHRWQPTRLPHPWDSPGKKTGVGCHFLLQCMKVKSESEVVQLCVTPSDPMDCSLTGSSIHGIFQARVLEWGAIAFSIIMT